MKVSYAIRKESEGVPHNFDNFPYEVKDVSFCCDKMKEWWERDFGFTESNGCVEVFGDEGIDGAYAKIDYCPFCGEKIEIEEVK